MTEESTPLSVVLFGCVGSLAAIVFGGYLVYEKALLPIRTGEALERIGLIERADDPVWFWISITLYGAIGSSIVLAGLAWPVSKLLSSLRNNRGNS